MVTWLPVIAGAAQLPLASLQLGAQYGERAGRPSSQPDTPTAITNPFHPAPDAPLIVLVGPTASGKSHLALRLAEQFAGEILSCDSVAVYREMEIGTAKPSAADRALIPHHGLDLVEPTDPFTAGDWARHARETLPGIGSRGRLALIAGGTGLYLRALLDGLFAAPPIDPALRARLRSLAETPRGGADGRSLSGADRLHRLLRRFDPPAAARIHPNDVPKAVRAVEVALTARSAITAQWSAAPREGLLGYRVLRFGLDPPRSALYDRINRRAAAMFDRGLVAETDRLLARFGPACGGLCRPFTSLGYAQAVAVLCGELSLEQAVAAAAQGHRNYAKRQLTWFRKEPATHWLTGFGDDPEILRTAADLVQAHLRCSATP